MGNSFVTKNTSSRERLRKMVNDVTDEELNFVIYKEGWTIAVVLAHFCDSLLNQRYFGKVHLNTEVSTGNQDSITCINNRLQMCQCLRCFNLGYYLDISVSIANMVF